MKKRVVMVGSGMRAVYAFMPYLNQYCRDRFEIVGIFDIDKGVMKGFNDQLQTNYPMFTDFDEMCNTVKPDLGIVTTVDQFHSQFIVKLLDRKIAVVSEKPVCTTAQQCKDLLEAGKRNPEVFAHVSHNARYAPDARKLHELVQEGAIGKVISVRYSEMLDRDHGTSYFRRWNSCKESSGGLQIHKASHHFDKINWILGAHAVSLQATGALLAYGSKNSPFHGERCHTCSQVCPYRVAYEKNPQSHEYQMFFKFREEGGYTPDLCIFRPEINIEDFLSVGIKYSNGACCSYMLTAQANYEGEDIIIDGEKGRLEFRRARYAGNEKSASDDVHKANTAYASNIILCRYGHGAPEEVPVIAEPGAHGGGDKRIFDDLFSDNPPENLPALEEGIQAVITGAAINESLKTHSEVDVQSLLK
ncbi:MAG: Gfo/Idh/MocA family oxidoreductase [Lentisphaerae bacterium]|nr:Gfo/Idh/MocA family oxidoreductase [Lentisphaerota bacterium]